uniref:hypothetical protein n=1 Tax=Ulva meridionalis TaxID=434723 RepID=UPI0028E0A226|nr:hypothetical protein NQY40_pgp023 [Ulva meridionalis]WFS80088.1 hypothetical protein [Ulva meridionalis]
MDNHNNNNNNGTHIFSYLLLMGEFFSRIMSENEQKRKDDAKDLKRQIEQRRFESSLNRTKRNTTISQGAIVTIGIGAILALIFRGNSQKQDVANSIKTISEEQKNIQNELESRQKTEQELKNDLNNLQAARQQLETELKNLQEQKTEQDSEQRQMTTQTMSPDSRVNSTVSIDSGIASGMVATITQSIAANTARIESNDRTINARIESNDRTINARIDSNERNLNERILKIESEMKDINAMLHSNKSKINRLKDRFNTFQGLNTSTSTSSSVKGRPPETCKPDNQNFSNKRPDHEDDGHRDRDYQDSSSTGREHSPAVHVGFIFIPLINTDIDLFNIRKVNDFDYNNLKSISLKKTLLLKKPITLSLKKSLFVKEPLLIKEVPLLEELNSSGLIKNYNPNNEEQLESGLIKNYNLNNEEQLESGLIPSYNPNNEESLESGLIKNYNQNKDLYIDSNDSFKNLKIEPCIKKYNDYLENYLKNYFNSNTSVSKNIINNNLSNNYNLLNKEIDSLYYNKYSTNIYYKFKHEEPIYLGNDAVFSTLTPTIELVEFCVLNTNNAFYVGLFVPALGSLYIFEYIVLLIINLVVFSLMTSSIKELANNTSLLVLNKDIKKELDIVTYKFFNLLLLGFIGSSVISLNFPLFIKTSSIYFIKNLLAGNIQLNKYYAAKHMNINLDNGIIIDI